MNTIPDTNVIQVSFGEDSRPKYAVLESAVRAAIDRGALPPGTRLPPVRELAWKIGVTPGTVARAYSRLTDKGILSAAVGRGTYVAEPVSARPAPLIADVIEDMIEVDSIPHRTGGDSYEVNLFSPHLPAKGQHLLIRKLLAQVAENPPSGMMHYPSRDGARAAREGVLTWLDNTPLGPVSESDIVLTHGGQSAIFQVLQTVLTGSKPTVLVEALSYPGFRRAAQALRANVVPVAMDRHGIVPEALAEAAQGCDAQVLCTSPEVHNPTCIFTPETRRLEIVEVARAHNLQIMEDDCYRMGRSQAACYRRLAPERGWYVSSIAKTVTPALRFGFAIAPGDWTPALRRSAEHGYFGLGTPLTDLAGLLLPHPDLPGQSAAARAEVNRYIQTAANHLGGYDLNWRMDVPFLWLTLPGGWRAGAFCQAAAGLGVRIRAAEEFAARDDHTPHAVRLAINAGVSLTSFEAAIRRLRDLLDNPSERIGV